MQKPQDTQVAISKMYAFCQKIQQSGLSAGESAVTYLSLRIHPKS